MNKQNIEKTFIKHCKDGNLHCIKGLANELKKLGVERYYEVIQEGYNEAVENEKVDISKYLQDEEYSDAFV